MLYGRHHPNIRWLSLGLFIKKLPRANCEKFVHKSFYSYIDAAGHCAACVCDPMYVPG